MQQDDIGNEVFLGKFLKSNKQKKIPLEVERYRKSKKIKIMRRKKLKNLEDLHKYINQLKLQISISYPW